MRIGVFDSGLGGLAIAQAIIHRLPQYDYLYLGDTKRVPYGGRSQEVIHEFTSEGVRYLFEHGCEIIVLACNTASAEALRQTQQEFLPKFYPDRRVLGVVIPTIEQVVSEPTNRTVAVLATSSTVSSRAYEREIRRQGSDIQVVQVAAPLLVPLIENNGFKYLPAILDDYLVQVEGADAVVLGCTHYSLAKGLIRERFKGRVYAQDEIIPEKMVDYLLRHPEIESTLGRHGERSYRVTDITPSYSDLGKTIAGECLQFQKVTL